jgi:K(+)-stimulated pyrophosphate-energized sodium pump
MLSVSDPRLFIGMLIGGAIPMLFSSMTIRAVGRAAYLIVNECRVQFRDKEIWEGKKKPDYAKVVAICTASAQKELVGPAFLAVFAPVLIGFLLGPVSLAGFLAGSIVVGQLLASFMCNSGGAWDNAKKTVEDEPTGDTVGDPLKDTAGPAVNPLLKVMNMVSILIVPMALVYDNSVVETVRTGAKEHKFPLPDTFTHLPIDKIWIAAVVVSSLALIWSIWQSRRESKEMTV